MRIPTEHKETKDSSVSKLQVDYIFPIEFLDIFGVIGETSFFFKNCKMRNPAFDLLGKCINDIDFDIQPQLLRLFIDFDFQCW